MGKQKRDVPSWQECADAGMTVRQAAEARGMTVNAAYQAARKYGVCFANGWTPEAKAANSARVKALHADPAYKAKRIAAMKAAWADPEFKAKRSAALKAAWADPRAKAKRVAAMNSPEAKARNSAAMKAAWADPEAKARRIAATYPHLAKLTAAERADYDRLRSKGYRRDEALAAIGRSDLVRADP